MFLLLVNPSATPQRCRSVCTSGVCFPRLVCFIFLRILAMGRISTPIRNSCWSNWRVPRFTSNLMECSLVGSSFNRNSGRYSSTSTFLTWTGKERSRGPVVCNCWSSVPCPRLVYLCLFNQHFSRIVRQR